MTVRTHPTGRFGLSALGLPALARRLGLAAASRIRVGRLTVVLPDGSRRTFGDAESELRAEIHVHDEAAAVRILLHGETGAGEAYMDGLWSSPDLVGLLNLAARNRSALALTHGWWQVPLQIRRTVAHRMRRNTRSGSRRNISAHYDLGNDFYRLFLDEIFFLMIRRPPRSTLLPYTTLCRSKLARRRASTVARRSDA